MMARLEDYYKDLGGIATTGTATAYVLTTNRAFASSAIMDGAVICIKPNADSGASPTLAVDGLTARAINYSTGVAIPTGALKTGTPYYVIYIHASTEFILLGAAGAISPLAGPCPVGGIMDFAAIAAPAGWLLCQGQAVSRTTYAALFAVIGTFYGVGNGTTTFNLPDCGGRVTAGKEASATRLTSGGSGVDGGTLGATGGAQTVTLDTTMIPAHTHDDGTYAAASNGAHSHTFQTNATIARGGSDKCADTTIPTGTDNTSSDGAHTHDVTGTSGSSGGGLAHNNAQPTIVLNKIIFAGV